MALARGDEFMKKNEHLLMSLLLHESNFVKLNNEFI
jgi:hypothetical protein